MAGRIDGKAGLKLVGAIQHQVSARDQALGIAVIQALNLYFDFNCRIKVLDRGLASADLINTDILRAKQNLPLKIGKIDHIWIDQDQASDPGSSQIKRRRRAQAAYAHQSHGRLCQSLLPGATNLFEENVPSMPVEADRICFHPAMMTAQMRHGKIAAEGGVACRF
jgi:hypothetical protein